MSIIISHATGNEFFRAAVKSFYEAGELQSVYTSIASFPDTWLYKLGAIKQFQDIKRRVMDSNFKPVTHTHPCRETGRLLSIKYNQRKLIQHETGMFSVDAVYKSLDRYVTRQLKKEQEKGATAIYGYEDGAAYSFREAKKLRLKAMYDLPIGYWRSMHNLLNSEKELNPEWAGTLEGLQNSSKKLARKDEEIALADLIIVASSFTAESLKAYTGSLPKIKIVPYGFPQVHEKTYRQIPLNNKIKLLFVGGLSQRKGLSYLFKAVEEFQAHVSLTIIGRGPVNNSKTLQAHLVKHIWIESLSHTEVLRQMQAHDILIFPSLFEGFGQVITEAMSQGTPVITTERTAGIDIIQHGENGWLVNAGSADAIKIILEQIIRNPEIIEIAGKRAATTAAARTWAVYEHELSAAVKEVMPD